MHGGNGRAISRIVQYSFQNNLKNVLYTE